eukprot:GEMP01028463.1.p1 GENE.GEMP01028463.1~~GEMP01028463.1.p1  ORF type:complete len:417 (+),score=40.78 GEMP01028463.1:183-1433(+)
MRGALGLCRVHAQHMRKSQNMWGTLSMRYHAAAASSAQSSNAVVLSKRVPEDFIKDTLKPHLESQILESIHIYVPAELVKISQAYVKIRDRPANLTQKLCDTVKYRMSSFDPIDIIDCLAPLYRINPDDDELYDVMAERIEQLLNEFNALNLVAIIRVYNKRKQKNFKLLHRALPILKNLLAKYDDAELCEMLLSIGASGDGVKDMDIMLVLLPEILKRSESIPLVEHLNNLWALSKLKLLHRPYLERVAKELENPKIGPDLPPKYLCRITWVYRKCGCFDLVSDTLMPLIRDSKNDFSTSEFARLSQAMPPSNNDVLKEVQSTLRMQIPEMGRQELVYLMLGSIHLGNLEVKETEGALLSEIMKVIREEQDNFRPEEVERIAIMLRTSEKYSHLLDSLPTSWYESVRFFLECHDF